MTPRGGIESEAAHAALSRRMIVTASGLTLLTVGAGRAVASGTASGGGSPSAAGPGGASGTGTSSSGAGLVPSPRSGAVGSASGSSGGSPSSVPGGSSGPGHTGSTSPGSGQHTGGGSQPPLNSGTGPGGSAGGSSGAPGSPGTPGGLPQAPGIGGPTSSPGSSTAGTPHPQHYVHGGDKAIALTIDDGPDGRYTPQVLALLAQYKITATFCMLGSSVKAHAGLVQEVAAAGHQIANHTFSHANLSKLDAGAVRSEITRANDALAAAGARPPAFFRAPFGAWSATVFQVCDEMGLKTLDWSVDPRDWSRPGTDQIVQTVLSRTHTGSIILEHDGGGDRSQTVAALGRFLPQLLEAGYKFVQP